MTVSGLARRPGVLNRRIGDAGTVDPYNTDLGTWEATPVAVYASQRRATETTDDAGQVDSEDWTVVWDLDVPAAASDRIEIPGQGIFELTGPSQRVLRPQTLAYHHTEATARRVV